MKKKLTLNQVKLHVLEESKEYSYLLLRTKLIAVAKELNGVLGLEPLIPLYSDNNMLRILIKSAASLIVEEDSFSKQTIAYLKDHKLWKLGFLELISFTDKYPVHPALSKIKGLHIIIIK